MILIKLFFKDEQNQNNNTINPNHLMNKTKAKHKIFYQNILIFRTRSLLIVLNNFSINNILGLFFVMNND